MFNPKVSIIIPVYNGANYLAEAINSALAQTYENIEILVINDGSNDNLKTEKIALGYGNKIKYFNKKNGGVSTALNLGINNSTGEYISWLSHDDLYYSNKIEEQIELLKGLKNKEQIIYSNIDIIDGKGIIQKKFIYKLENINDNNFVFYLLTEHFINGCTLLIPKKVFDKIGFFNEKLKTVQDYDMWFRMYKKNTFIKLNKSLIMSRSHKGQDSQNINIFIIMMKEEKEVYLQFIKRIGLFHIYTHSTFLLFFKKIIFGVYFKFKFILPFFIFLGKYLLGKKFISYIRKNTS